MMEADDRRIAAALPDKIRRVEARVALLEDWRGIVEREENRFLGFSVDDLRIIAAVLAICLASIVVARKRVTA